ncbi:MAG: 4-(cytidine 5'-diphospho)-2-C-methyl-D-erythritol kinase [Ignavibacteriae bacterium]|nr:4-(cytidine 5'-diphospho)-2-C-methyl-D-erythritol kinase [Ignavibacteria bacterium]MBI3365060.1 4-(cytidine 5'-diphospho)-2-C-methyl-D-erythritol kinase [Ignavibacteriota bacterium]
MNLKAYAKINLGLRILRKREDGYHDIETIFHRVNIFDEIALSPSNTISMECSDASIPTDERNLCIKTARLLEHESRAIRGVQIILKKDIPVGAGLGGGSSDAAAVLLGLNKLWQLNLSHEMLRSLALTLGADVPYFLRSGSAFATGRGEILEYFSLDVPYWIVLVCPNIHVSTAWAYQNTHITYRTPVVSGVEPLHISLKEIVLNHITYPKKLQTHLHNDFEPLVFATHKSVSHVKDTLIADGAVFAQMSGSGSSVYGFFTSEQQARAVMNEFGRRCRVFLTPPNFRPNE